MAVENGKPVGNGKAVSGVNEKPNGHLNGHLNGHAGSHTTTSIKRRTHKRKSWKSWLLNNIARLFTWYAIITVIFRCPSNLKDLSDASPRICQPYLGAVSQVQPYVQPYYDAHAARYIEKAMPYVEKANVYVTVPASTFVRTNYQKYAAPELKKLKSYTVAKWDRMMLPKFLLAQERASEIYSANLAPHVDKASSIAAPIYEAAVDNADYVNQQHILPALKSSKPYLYNAYDTTQKFVLKTALPVASQGWSKLVIFVDGTLWPFVKGIYSDNVRPQLVMISERIATYQEGRKLGAAMDEMETSAGSGVSSASASEPTVSSSNVLYTVTESVASVMSSFSEKVSSSMEPKSARETETATEESITEDLVKWEKKFALAAEKGTEDLQERVKDIIGGLIKSDVEVDGKGLAIALEKTVDAEIADVKYYINTVVTKISDDASTLSDEEAETEIVNKIRQSGLEIKDKATTLRKWVQKFQSDIHQRTSLAADSTLRVLDGIRDLGLQEIGMRWAWMDGVTYKHWAKYHDLKQQLDEWREEVRAVALGHPSLKEAKEAAEQLFEEGMATTEEAAKELIRLKEVAKWKLRARDTTDDFDTKVLPAAAVSAASKLAEEIQGVASSLTSTTENSVESLVDQATQSMASFSDAAFSSVSSLLPSASSVASSLSTSMLDTPSEPVQSSLSEAFSSVSSAIVGTSTGSIEELTSSASELASDAYESASSAAADARNEVSSVIQIPPVEPSSLSSTAEEIYESVSASASSVSSRVFAGAMAQEVKGQIPILDDVFDDDTKESFSESVASMVSEAGDQYADITKALSEALYGNTKGSVESYTSLASEQYQSALSAASRVLYGTPTPAAEILASAAQSRYSQAVAAASSVIYSKQQSSLAESVLREASAAYSAAVSQAQDYRSAAADVVSKQIGASPKPIHSQMLESIASAYEGSVAIASARLDEAYSAASKQYTSMTSAASAALPTQNRMESVSSMASLRLQDALSAANSQYHSIKVAVGAEPAPASLQAQQAYYAAIGYAHEQYDNFLSAGSSAVYGTATPAYQSLVAQASSQYHALSVAASSTYASYLSSLSSVASKATKTKSPAQSLLDEASVSYSSALSVASVSLAAASASASIAIFGTPTPAYQPALEAITSQYAAATALAAANMDELLKSASSAVGKKQKSPAQSVLDSISSQYEIAVAAASSSLSAASSSASVAIYGTPLPAYQSALDAVTSQYAVATAIAVSNMQELLKSASSAVGKKQKSPAQSVLDDISSQYSIAVVAASSSLLAASSSASYAFYGPSEGSLEYVASAASSNWEALIAAASTNIYGKPTPVWASVTSQAGELTAQATDAAVEKFAIISAYVSEVIVGQEPDFSESVMSRLSAAYYTGVVASASSLASEAYASGSSIASSVSSVASTYFTPPPEVNSILDNVSAQLNSALEAASAQVYGSSKGTIERAASAAADAYSSASGAASEALYGTPAGYGEAASSSIFDAAQSASEALSVALFGTATGTIESATSAAADTYSSISSAVSDSLSSAADQAASMADTVQAKISEAVYGPEQSALESARSRVLEAVESARSRLSDLSASASGSAESVASIVSETVESVASDVSKSVSSVTSRVKDEL